MALYSYKSTDAGAPVLNPANAALTLTEVYDSCLVSGYGAFAAAGWTKEYTGGAAPPETYAFRMPASSPIRHYLEIESYYDTTVPRTDLYATFQGYEAMTGLTTGTNPYPAGKTLRAELEERGADSAHDWWLWTDNRTVIQIHRTDPTTGGVPANARNVSLQYFGELFSYKPSDTTNMLIGASDYSTAVPYAWGSYPMSDTDGSTAKELRMYKDHTGTVDAGVNVMLNQSMAYHSTGIPGGPDNWGGVMAYPNGPDGSIYFVPVEIRQEVAGAEHIRGRLRGLWGTAHAVGNFTDGDIIIGSGAIMGGRQFLVFNRNNSGAQILPTQDNPIFVETTDTWETNG
jgi:hypothetical protein